MTSRDSGLFCMSIEGTGELKAQDRAPKPDEIQLEKTWLLPDAPYFEEAMQFIRNREEVLEKEYQISIGTLYYQVGNSAQLNMGNHI